MFGNTKAFSSFSVDDLQQAKQFYSETLGLDVVETPEGLELHIAGSTPVFVYPSNNYTAPKHTVLNFPVEDIEAAVDELAERGVRMEHYDLPDLKTNERGSSEAIPARAPLPGSRTGRSRSLRAPRGVALRFR
jgi:catechol 2,3-dioxygenase-like lactoylglutathione lyase family enzyme